MNDPEHAPDEHHHREARVKAPRGGPLIWVASLADYNDGRLVGQWIDAARDDDEVATDISTMLATSASPGAEEWAIFDHEGFSPIHINEYESLERISAVARNIADKGPAFAHLASLVGLEEALVYFEDVYIGHRRTFESYVEELVEDCGYIDAIEKAIPESLQPYVTFDIDQFAYDLELSGDYVTSEGDDGVYIFDMGRM
jgi:antirestriction protein